MPQDSRRTPAEVFIHLIKSGPGLRPRQAWEPLVYTLGSLRHFSQCPDVHS